MIIHRPVLALIVGFVLLSSAIIVSADKPDGKGKDGGGGAEETASNAQLFDAASYALRGDGEVGGDDNDTSLYQDSTLLDSTDCALVIATRIDKQSGTAFLWVPSPRRDDANCESGHNRWFESDYPIFEDIDGKVHAKIQLAGLYRPIVDVIEDGVIVSVAIGPYRIEYPATTIPVEIVDSDDDSRDGFGDIRTVTIDETTTASICAWPTGKQKGKTICESYKGGEIQLPMKIKFTRIPPQ